MNNVFKEKKLESTSANFLNNRFWRFLRKFLNRKSWTFLYTLHQKNKWPKLVKLLLHSNHRMPDNLISVFSGSEDINSNKKISQILKDNHSQKPDNGYLNFLDDEFEQFRNKKNFILEIGIGNGSSLACFKDYFYKSKIIGFDINPNTFVKEDRVECYKFDQFDLGSSEKLMSRLNLCFNIIIDDGWHHPETQIKTLLACLKYLNHNGVYIIEDIVHSHYGEFFIELGDIFKKKGFKSQYYNFKKLNDYGMSGVLKIERS